MKVGREQIAGLLAAVARYVAAPGADDADGIRELRLLRDILTADDTFAVAWHESSALGVPALELALADAGIDVDEFVTALAHREMPVYLEESEAWRGALLVNPMALGAGDARRIADAVRDILHPVAD